MEPKTLHIVDDFVATAFAKWAVWVKGPKISRRGASHAWTPAISQAPPLRAGKCGPRFQP